MALSPSERKSLLHLAQGAVRECAERPGRQLTDAGPPDPSGAFSELRGVLVAIYRRGELRGCMGSPLGVLPLWQACMEASRDAACKDPRFTPLSREDLSHMRMEIIVVGALTPFTDISQLEGGTCGLVARKGLRQEVFLPGSFGDMPCEMSTLLERLRSKAALDVDEPDAVEEWEVFEAEVIADES